MRIVSLIPSATEIVCALGLRDNLVGVSHECDYPEGVETLPTCTEPKINIHGTSAEINQQVQQLLQNALSVYDVKTDLLEELQPTHIITQSQCEVCAVSLQDVEKAVAEQVSSKPTIISLQPSALEDVWDDIDRVAEALNVAEKGKEVSNSLRKRAQDLADQTDRFRRKPTVVCLEWIDPLMASGHWMPTIIKMAGGVSLMGEKGKPSPSISWNELHGKDPEMIILTPCGFTLERTREEAKVLSDIQDWQALRAVQTGKVFITDGHNYFNRPGPRLYDSIEILAEIFQPNKFKFGYKGTAWDKL